jgi:hypothetical protein
LSGLGEIAEVTQSILYSPELEARGVLGNCLQASVASALGLELDAVPHFASFAWWTPAVRLWLRGRCLDWRQVDGIPSGRSIVVGRTKRGTGDHAVVGDGGKVVWDPHPSRAGLTEVMHSYVLERWPTGEPSACVCCGPNPRLRGLTSASSSFAITIERPAGS